MDLGLPDGLVAAYVMAPRHKVRAHAGLGFNANNLGVRLGGRYDLLRGQVSPFGALELGHYFSAETPDWMRETAKDAGLNDKTLVRLGYTFINAHLGLRFGGPRVGVYVQGGVSFVAANARVIKPKPNFTPPVELTRDTFVHLWLLSGRLGVEMTF